MINFDTVLPADSLEFCPTANFHSLFVCGTYKLEDQPVQQETGDEIFQAEEGSQPKPPQKRWGKCLVFKLPDSTQDLSFEQVQSFDLPAILDMKWSHRSDSLAPLLGIADSEGSITLHEWQEDALTQTESIRCAPEDSLVLSLDWSNRRSRGSDMGAIVASLSNGSICILRASDSGNMEVTDTWHGHDYEPWVAAWNYWDTNVIYSGGDDLKFKAWDIRQGFDQPVVTNKRFDAGVTSIQSHPHVENILAVGSYNNTVKIFDTRRLSTPLTEVDVGGGAWRIKWHPSPERQNDLLVASMHDGFKVVRLGTGPHDNNAFSGASEIINRNDEHSSMAYGADWSYAMSNSDKATIIGGCSFYDHKMSVWLA